MIWFTSDTHFNHKLSYVNRGFTSIEEMDEELIKRWNSVINKGDIVYHLGDFMFEYGKKDEQKVETILKRLNGNKQLIIGNHDRKFVKSSKEWSWVGHYKKIIVEKRPVVLMHYPIFSWEQKQYNSYHLHGHVHGLLNNHKLYKKMQALDVGVDSNDFYPLEYQDVKCIMNMKKDSYNKNLFSYITENILFRRNKKNAKI